MKLRYLLGGLGLVFLSVFTGVLLYVFLSFQRTGIDFDLTSRCLTSFPELPDRSRTIAGVREYVVDLGVDQDRPGHNDTIKIYTSEPPPTVPTPTVFIAPAGATDFTGKRLGPGDLRECLPYAMAGFIVVAYELDGDVNIQSATKREARNAFGEYEASQAGLVNARNAMEFAIAKVPQVDPQRLYTVGHSSAGRQALLWSAFEPRLQGCAVFAPSVRFDPQQLKELARIMPFRYQQSQRLFMPTEHQDQIRCPTFVVQGTTDKIVRYTDNEKFSAELIAQNGVPSRFDRVSADHFKVVDLAIPKAITWLRELAGINNQPIPLPPIGPADRQYASVYQDLLTAWNDESLPVEIPTNHQSVSRFRINGIVADADYDPLSGLLVIAQKEGGLAGYDFKQLRASKKLPALKWDSDQHPHRVALKRLGEDLIVATWQDDGLALFDWATKRQLGPTLFTSGIRDETSDEIREIASTEDPGDRFLLARWKDEFYQVEIDTLKPTAVSDPGLYAKLGELPIWRSDPMRAYLVDDDEPFPQPAATKEQDAQRRRELPPMAVWARLHGDGPTYSLWKDPEAANVFNDNVLRSPVPVPLVQDLWSVIDEGRLGVFLTKDMVGIQSNSGGQVLVAEPISQQTFAASKKLIRSTRDFDRTATVSESGTPWRGMKEIEGLPEVQTALWGSEREDPRFTFPKPNYKHRRPGWIFEDRHRKLTVLVSDTEIFVFDLNQIAAPVLSRPPLQMFARVEQPISLPLSKEHAVQSVRMDGRDITQEIITKGNPTFSWTPELEDAGDHKLEWDTKTSWGLETLSTQLNVRFKTYVMPLPATEVAATTRSSKVLAWTAHRDPAPTFLMNDDNSTPRYLPFDGMLYDVVCCSDMLGFLSSIPHQERRDPKLASKITVNKLGGTRGEASKQMPLIRGGLRSIPDEMLIQLSKITGEPLTPLDSGHNSCHWGKDGTINRYRRGVLWTGAPSKPSLLVNFSDSANRSNVTYHYQTYFGGEFLLLSNEGCHVTVPLKDDRFEFGNGNLIGSPLRGVEKGVYLVKLEATRLGLTRVELRFVPFRKDSRTITVVLDPETRVTRKYPAVRVSVSAGCVWINFGKNIYRLKREWFESQTLPPRLAFKPRQSTFTMAQDETQTVKYECAGATKYTLIIGDGFGRSPIVRETSKDGTFEIDLRDQENRLRRQILKAAARTSPKDELIPKFWQEKQPEIQAWANKQRSVLEVSLGIKTDRIPLEQNALVIAENEHGERAALFHNYLVMLPTTEE